jgi:hypothetical protein
MRFLSFLLLCAVSTFQNGSIPDGGGPSEKRIKITKDSSALANVRTLTDIDEIKPKKGEKNSMNFMPCSSLRSKQ